MKTALLVGVNRYVNLPGNNLRGCLNDVDDMRKLLSDVYGFNRILILQDSEAYRENILDVLRMVIKDSEDGDELVFLFSGHGTQIPDLDGDESDGYDECLCPADTSMENDDALIRDDELREIFDRLPSGVNLTVITDCCHSGTITRDVRMGISNRYLDRGFAPSRRNGSIDIESRWLHISGCRDNETSADAEFNGRPNGALVYALIHSARQNPNSSAREIHAEILDFLDKNRYDQHPVLNGCMEARKRHLFGGAK